MRQAILIVSLSASVLSSRDKDPSISHVISVNFLTRQPTHNIRCVEVVDPLYASFAPELQAVPDILTQFLSQNVDILIQNWTGRDDQIDLT